VVASERVARGADWLDRRWQEGGPKLKQLAIATRADGLTLPLTGGADNDLVRANWFLAVSEDPIRLPL
jgi:hypothetical protein